MQHDMPNGSSNPFTQAHKAAERKAEASQAAQQVVSRDARIADTAKRRSAMAKPSAPYVPAGPWWGPK